MMLAVAELAPRVGLRSACQAFALNRGFVYRDRARRSVTARRRKVAAIFQAALTPAIRLPETFETPPRRRR